MVDLVGGGLRTASLADVDRNYSIRFDAVILYAIFPTVLVKCLSLLKIPSDAEFKQQRQIDFEFA